MAATSSTVGAYTSRVKICKAIKTVLKRLLTGSEVYDLVYKAAVERIKGQIINSQELAEHVLYITCTKSPLTTLKLRHAFAVEIGKSALDEGNLREVEDIISVCIGLVTVGQGSNIICLVYYTVQEYFEQNQVTIFLNSQTDITINCVTYLLFNTFEIGICATDEEFKDDYSRTCFITIQHQIGDIMLAQLRQK
jgi:hypothetical protein